MDADRAANFTRRWHTTTFRWLCAYAAIFSVSLLLLAGVINVAATHTMARAPVSRARSITASRSSSNAGSARCA